jgi:hypothetical protein
MRRREFLCAASAAIALPIAARGQIAAGHEPTPSHRTYYVSPHIFAEQFPDFNHESHRIAIGQLIERYGIRNKRLLSLGGGSVFEERWFVTLGANALTVIDIDEHKSAESRLRTGEPGPMKYIVGDALNFDAGEHDVLYLSSFTPDEMRRYDFIAPKDGPRRFWRIEWDPFHPAVMQHASRLTPGGLMIVQSIGYSLDAVGHPQYIPACQRQLAENGFDLIELWRFQKTVGVMLYVAQKRGGQRPPLQAPLTAFHSRAAAREPIERLYPVMRQK